MFGPALANRDPEGKARMVRLMLQLPGDEALGIRPFDQEASGGWR